MAVQKVALLTAGGLAPCLSSAVGALIQRYSEVAPEVEIIAYRGGYQGLLLGDSIRVTADVRKKAHRLHLFGGSPLVNSRVKLTNVADCVKRGLVKEGEDPQKVAADQLVADDVDVLHTIGGDDTNTAAADLADYLAHNDYGLQVVGLPKTIDNDIIPVKQSLGAFTAADEGARFFSNVVSEHSANPRTLIVHEVMGRHCGWLTAATARAYRRMLDEHQWVDEFGVPRENREVHAVFLPEMEIDLEAEAVRLKSIMDDAGNVNIFLSEGAGVDSIVAQMDREGLAVPRDPFGHVKLDKINPGAWFAERFAPMINARKVLIQKSGYFARSAAANERDLVLIKSCVDTAVEVAFAGGSGVVGHDEGHRGRLRAIEFHRIKGGKAFDIDRPWFTELLADIGQAKRARVGSGH